MKDIETNVKELNISEIDTVFENNMLSLIMKRRNIYCTCDSYEMPRKEKNMHRIAKRAKAREYKKRAPN